MGQCDRDESGTERAGVIVLTFFLFGGTVFLLSAFAGLFWLQITALLAWLTALTAGILLGTIAAMSQKCRSLASGIMTLLGTFFGFLAFW